jgi:hypothetical protein
MTFIPGGSGGGGGGGGAGPPSIVVAAPLPVEDWTIAGSMGLIQIGTSILAQSANPSVTDDLLAPLPEGVVPGGPWALTCAAQVQADVGAFYPGFGVLLANGVTPGSSLALFVGVYQFNGYMSLASWTQNVSSQNRPSGNYFATNQLNVGASPYYLRLLCDGTNYWHQYSLTRGFHWKTMVIQPIGTPGLGTPTHYGASLGSNNGSGNSTALITGLSMVPLSQIVVTNVVTSTNLFTVTTASAHQLATGASITLTALMMSTGSFSGFFDSSVVVTSPTSFTVPVSGASGTYVSGGLVTLGSS